MLRLDSYVFSSFSYFLLHFCDSSLFLPGFHSASVTTSHIYSTDKHTSQFHGMEGTPRDNNGGGDRKKRKSQKYGSLKKNNKVSSVSSSLSLSSSYEALSSHSPNHSHLALSHHSPLPFLSSLHRQSKGKPWWVASKKKHKRSSRSSWSRSNTLKGSEGLALALSRESERHNNNLNGNRNPNRLTAEGGLSTILSADALAMLQSSPPENEDERRFPHDDLKNTPSGIRFGSPISPSAAAVEETKMETEDGSCGAGGTPTSMGSLPATLSISSREVSITSVLSVDEMKISSSSNGSNGSNGMATESPPLHHANSAESQQRCSSGVSDRSSSSSTDPEAKLPPIRSDKFPNLHPIKPYRQRSNEKPKLPNPNPNPRIPPQNQLTYTRSDPSAYFEGGGSDMELSQSPEMG